MYSLAIECIYGLATLLQSCEQTFACTLHELEVGACGCVSVCLRKSKYEPFVLVSKVIKF